MVFLQKSQLVLGATLLLSALSFAADSKSSATKLSDADCKSKAAQAKQSALACLDISDAEKRRACMDKVGKTLPENFDQVCKSYVDPVKEEIKSKEAKKYPNQPSSMDGKGGNQGGNQGGNTGGDRKDNGANKLNDSKGPENKGPENKGGDAKGSAPKMSDADCKSKTAEAKQNALACLDISDAEKRRACMDKVGKSLPENFDQVCKNFVEPAKEEIKTKEAKKYPNQPSSMDGKGGNQGGNQGGNTGGDRKDNGANKPNDSKGPENKGPENKGPENKGGDMKGAAPKISDADCKSKTAQAKQSALACLDTADAEKRRACMDKVGKTLPEGFDQACKSYVDPVKEEIKSKEAKKYPNQPSSMNPNNGGTR